MANLQIAMFGGLSMEADGQPLPQIPSRTGRSLFAYLVTHRDTAPTRELLAGMFWPDMLETQARRRLSHALWQIQSVLSESAGLDSHIETTPTSIRFNPSAEVVVDVDEFDATLKTLKASDVDDSVPGAKSSSRLIEAARLYRGDFMAGFYDDWIVVEQERLREGHFAVLSHIVRLSKSWGDFEQALVYARRLALLNPVREDVHREIMRLTYLLGRPNEALQQYERCASILASELGTEPATETRALRLEIASGRESPIIPVSRTSRARLFDEATRIPLVGRASERQAMVERMEDALARRGGIVLVEGDAGTGKTRFLAECAEDANWRGLNVVWGGFISDDISRPFEGLAAALEEGLTELRVQQLRERIEPVWLQSVAPLVPTVQQLTSDLGSRVPLERGEERERVQEAFQRMFLTFAELTPTVLVLDDVHRADDDTLAVLAALAHNLENAPLLVCLAYRRHELEDRPEQWSTIRALDRAGPVGRIGLESFSASETGELMRRLMPDGARAEVVELLQSATGGNPLFVLETLRAIHDQQVNDSLKPPEALSGIQLENLPLSPTISEQLDHRLARLPGDARHVAQVLAANRGGFDIDSLASVSGLPRPQMLDALETLSSAAMITVTRGQYSLSHDQLARVAYESIPPAERPGLHRRIGLELEKQATVDATVLAHHFQAGDVAGKAAGYLEQAGREAAAVGAYEAARRRLEEALRESARAGSSVFDQVRVRLALERIYEVVGDPDGQKTMLDELEAVAGDDPELGAELLHRRAWLLGATSEFPRAASVAEAALRMHTDLGDDSGRARDLRVLGRILMWSRRYGEAIEALETGRMLAEPGTRLEAEILHALSDIQAERSEFTKARYLLEAAADIYQRIDDKRGVAATLSSLAYIQGSTADEAVAATLERASRLCEEIGYRYGVAINALNLGVHYYSVGRTARALSPTLHARSVFQSLQNSRGEVMALTNLAAVYYALGDDQAAERYARAGLAATGDGNMPEPAGRCLTTLARVALRNGDSDDAENRIKAARALSGTPESALDLQLSRTLAEIRLRQGRPRRALELAESAMTKCRDLNLGWLIEEFCEISAHAHIVLEEPEKALAYTEHPSGSNALALLYWRRQAYQQLGDWEAAYAALDDAHEILIRELEGLSDEDTRQALSRMQLHREIHAAWKATRPQVVTVRLAAANAPTGRPLAENETVTMQWTVRHPLDDRYDVGSARRSHQLLRLGAEAEAAGAAPTVMDLAAVLGVSSATVRRDLSALRKTGTSVTTRGRRAP